MTYYGIKVIRSGMMMQNIYRNVKNCINQIDRMNYSILIKKPVHYENLVTIFEIEEPDTNIFTIMD